jgi:hypothetical protein
MRLTQPVALILTALSLFGCRDDRAEADGDDGSTSVTDPTLDPETGTGDSSSTDVDPTDTLDPDTSSSGGPVEVCETQWCGQPAECCDDDEECVLGACLPACDTNVRCGEDLTVCCPDGDVCLQPDCVTPGQPCLDSFDCPEGEFCEPQLGACLPNQDPVACELEPDFGPVELTLEWSFETDEIISMPAVGDLDGDDLPDVVVSSIYFGNVLHQGELIVLNGQTGQLKLRITEDPINGEYGAYSRSTAAIGDVDGNGLADIVYSGWPMGGNEFFNYSLVHAVNGLGQHLWTAHNANGSDHPIYTRAGAVTLANLDDDEESEVVYGIAVMDNDGLVVSDDYQNEWMLGGGVFGSNSNYLGGVATVADLTGDNYPEIVSGREAWSVDWTQPAVGNPVVSVTPFWADPGFDGYPAVADLDNNGSPEVVLVGTGTMRVLDGATGQLWCGVDSSGTACNGNDAARTQPIDLPTTIPLEENRGGPPTIADFDGDGRVEVGVAGATQYVVYDFNRDGEEIVQPGGELPPGPGDAYVRWTAPIQDGSSNLTGSSVFDFQGDGSAEVLYQDECYARVFDGSSGEVLIEIENSSVTVHEYPIIVDVDADGNSEFVVVANDTHDELCVDTIPGYVARRGVFVYGDANDRWVPTRQVWTQHTYHVTNADSHALTPLVEEPNWLQPDLNNFRQNVQGEGIFNAPDLSIDVAVGLQNCLDEQFEITVTVRNEGSLGVPAGLPVTLWEGEDSSGMLIGTMFTSTVLLPGGFEQITWAVGAPAEEPKTYYATVDGAEIDTGSVLECNEDNNEGTTATVACPTPQ